MATMQTMFLIILVGLIFYFLGRHFKDYTSGLLGGLTILTTGVIILLNPIENIVSLANLLLGSICFAFGAYVFVVGSLEAIKERTLG